MTVPSPLPATIRAREPTASGGGAGADEGDELAFALFVGFPDFFGRNVVDEVPGGFIFGVFAPVGLEEVVVDASEIAVEPSGDVYAVGDGGDGDFAGGELWPEVLPHFAGDFAVE